MKLCKHCKSCFLQQLVSPKVIITVVNFFCPASLSVFDALDDSTTVLLNYAPHSKITYLIASYSCSCLINCKVYPKIHQAESLLTTSHSKAEYRLLAVSRCNSVAKKKNPLQFSILHSSELFLPDCDIDSPQMY